MATSSPRLQATQTFITAFKTLSAPDSLSVRAPDCKQIFAPSSLSMAPAGFTNEQFAEHFSHFEGILKSFPVYPKEIVDNPTAGQVTVWATSEVMWCDEVMDLDGMTEQDWRYEGEYIFVLDFEENERGEQKVKRILEFVDSKGTERLRELMARARANRARIDEAGHV